MSAGPTRIATLDARSVLERALAYGWRYSILNDTHLSKMQEEGAKALVQIANYFGTAYLRQDLDMALVRFINLASLYLEEKFGEDLQNAAFSVRDNTLLSHSRGGSELLKRLHVMPEHTLMMPNSVTANELRNFLDERSFALPMTADTYRSAWAERVENQQRIAFGLWIGRKLGGSDADLKQTNAEAVIRSAILACTTGSDTPRLPTQYGFVKILAAVREPSFKLKREVWQRMMRNAPPDFHRIGDVLMVDFEQHLLPKLKSPEYSANDFISGNEVGVFYVEEGVEEDMAEFERAVAPEWHKVTQGRSDPDLLATIFLSIATGMPPKRSLLLREAKLLIKTFRQQGFNSTAVDDFIQIYAPHDKRDDLLEMWSNDLLPESQVALSDPSGDDTRLVRALAYLRENCIANWKSGSR